MHAPKVLLLTPDGVVAGVLERRLRRLGMGVARGPRPGAAQADVALLDLRVGPPARPPATAGTPLHVLADDPDAALREVDAPRAVAMLPTRGGDADREIGLAVRVSAALGT